MKSSKENTIGSGVGIGIIVGVIIGSLMDNVGLGIALGIVLGAALGDNTYKKKWEAASGYPVPVCITPS